MSNATQALAQLRQTVFDAAVASAHTLLVHSQVKEVSMQAHRLNHNLELLHYELKRALLATNWFALTRETERRLPMLVLHTTSHCARYNNQLLESNLRTPLEVIHEFRKAAVELAETGHTHLQGSDYQAHSDFYLEALRSPLSVVGEPVQARPNLRVVGVDFRLPRAEHDHPLGSGSKNYMLAYTDVSTVHPTGLLARVVRMSKTDLVVATLPSLATDLMHPTWLSPESEPIVTTNNSSIQSDPGYEGDLSQDVFREAL